MFYVLKVVFIIITLAIYVETLPVNILDKKINTIKDTLELEIQLIRYELTRLTVNFDDHLHGLNAMPGGERTDGIQKTHADLATFKETTIRNDDLSNILARAFNAEKMALKKSTEEMKVQLIETAKHMTDIEGLVSSHESDIAGIENQINNILEIEDRNNMALIQVRGQLHTFNEQLDSLSNNVRVNMDYVKN